MSFYPPDSGGGGGGTVVDPAKILPDGYEYRKSAGGKLQLWQGSVMVSEQDKYGDWIKTGLTTGTGSIHVGDLHSMGSGGENVIWKNNDSNIAYYPSWAGVSTDGATAFDMTARTHGALSNAEPNGAVHASIAVDYNTTFTATADVAFFSVDIVPTESYTGKLMWLATKSTNNEVAEFYIDVVATAGQVLSIPFKYPLWMKNGQTFTVKLAKEDGSILKARAGVSDTTKPYRKTYFRTFTDKAVLTDVPAAYNPNKVMRFVSDFVANNGVGFTQPFTCTVVSAATMAVIGSDGADHVCLWDISSSTTAGSGLHVGAQLNALPHSAKPTLTFYFKMPTVINANTLIQIGTSTNASADRTCLEISGSTAQARVVVGGITTASGGTYTMAADTWYIARVVYGGDNNATFSLYSATGTQLYTYTANTALFAGQHIGFRATNSGVLAVPMLRADMIEITIPISGRYYLE